MFSIRVNDALCILDASRRFKIDTQHKVFDCKNEMLIITVIPNWRQPQSPPSLGWSLSTSYSHESYYQLRHCSVYFSNLSLIRIGTVIAVAEFFRICFVKFA